MSGRCHQYTKGFKVEFAKSFCGRRAFALTPQNCAKIRDATEQQDNVNYEHAYD